MGSETITPTCSVGAGVLVGQQRGAGGRGEVGEEGQAGAGLERAGGGDVGGPGRGADAGVVGHAEGDHAGAGGVVVDAGDGRAGAGGRDDRDLPGVGGHEHRVGADGALGAVAAGEDEHLAAGVGLGATVGLEIGPDALVVVRLLGQDVGEDEGLLAVGVGDVAVGVGAHVAAVIAGVGVVGVGDALHAGGQGGVGDEVATEAPAALVGGGEAPARPLRGAVGADVADRVLRALDEVVGGGGTGGAGIAEDQLVAGADGSEDRRGERGDQGADEGEAGEVHGE